MKRQPIEIFFAADDNFAQHLCVAIVSLLYNADEQDVLNLYIMNKQLSQMSQGNILALKKIKECNIEFIRVDNKLWDNFKSPEYINSSSTFYRYLVPEIKPELNKVLYLDADIVVKKSLCELFDTSMDDYYIAGVEDVHEFVANTQLKPRFQCGETYLNAGVLLLNCKKMRENNFSKKCFDLTPQLNTCTYWGADQDVFNILCSGNKKIIDLKYNVLSAVFDPRKNTQYSDSQIANAIENPVIIHFTDRVKPWDVKNFPYNQFAFEYHRYLALTPYAKSQSHFLIKSAFYNKSVSKALSRIKNNHFVKTIFSIIDFVLAAISLVVGILSFSQYYKENKRKIQL